MISDKKEARENKQKTVDSIVGKTAVRPSKVD